MSAAADPLVGRTLGPCRFLRRLGAGAMGVVYQVEHEEHGALCAKVVRPDMRAEGDMLRRFRREAEAARRVEHPNVVRGFGLQEVEGFQFLLQELLAGGDLKEYLRERRRLSPGEALRLIREVALGLSAAHAQGLVHRDLKPGNVLLDDRRRAKVTDFGLVLQVDGQPLDGKTILTQKGQTLGTPAYMAPEQWRGAHEVDARADLYALGVMLHQMLAGAPPFRGDSIIEVMTAHLRDDPPPLRSELPGAPEAVEALVLELLHKKPEDRPASAAAVAERAEAIARALGLADALEPPPSGLAAPPALDAEAPTQTPAAAFAKTRAQAPPPGSSAGSSLVNTLVDQKFEVLDEIGRGGMGVVYRARHSLLGSDYALKVLHPSLASDADFRARFLREARALQSFVHEAAVTLRELGEHQGALYMAMDFIDGRTVDAVVDEDGPFDQTRALALARDVLPCLSKAHAAGLVHRDLKPQNLIVESLSGGAERARVLDFGIAKILHDAGQAKGAGGDLRTATGVAIGTMHYMSPEQAAGDPIDARADIYSFACVLYEVIAGRRPFDAETQQKLYYKINFEEPEPLERLAGGRASPRFAAEVMAALAKKAADRPATAADFLRRLEAAAAVPAAPPPAKAARPGGRPAKRRGGGRAGPPPGRRAAPGRAGAAAGAAAGSAAVAGAAHGASAARGRPGRRPRRAGFPWVLAGLGCAVVVVLGCCGGLTFLSAFGMDMIAEEIESDLSGNRTLQSHLGPLHRFEPLMGRSLMSGEPDTYFFEVEGDWGRGVLEVHTIQVGGVHEAVSAQLTLSTGEVIILDLGDDPWGGRFGK